MTNTKVKFTFFINPVYFITWSNKSLYKPPHNPPPRSMIGYAGSTTGILQRLKCMYEAKKNGHEIGSHAVGHHNGSKWTYKQWKHEFTEFNKLIKHVNFDNKFLGFRAPELGNNDNMYKVLKEFGYKYDCSQCENQDTLAYKETNGIWIFPLSYFKKKRTTNDYYLISMDYNWYYWQSGCSEWTTDVKKLRKWENDVYNNYIDYFNNCYNGKRAAVHIGNHFSSMNGNIYWNALKRFIQTVSLRSNVQFMTYSELVEHSEKRIKYIDSLAKR